MTDGSLPAPAALQASACLAKAQEEAKALRGKLSDVRAAKEEVGRELEQAKAELTMVHNEVSACGYTHYDTAES